MFADITYNYVLLQTLKQKSIVLVLCISKLFIKTQCSQLASKTELIIFHPKQKHTTKHLNFRLSGQKLTPTNSIKYLGVILDKHLSWEPHMKTILSKLNRAAGMLAKIRHYLPAQILLSIYHAIFNSHLIYGAQIWGQGNSELRNKLQNIQNKAIRIINFKWREDPVAPLYYKSKILKLEDHIKLTNCLLAYNQQNKNLPAAFESFLTPISEKHSYNTRTSKLNLNIQQTNTKTYGTNSMKSKTATSWNELMPIIIKNTKLNKISKSILKQKLYLHLLDKYIN